MFNDSASEVARERADYEKTFLTEVGTIWRGAKRKGRDASSATDHKPIAPMVRCGITSDSDGADVQEGEQMVSVISFRLSFALGTDIRSTDQIEIKGERYAIVGEPDHGRSGARLVEAKAVKTSNQK